MPRLCSTFWLSSLAALLLAAASAVWVARAPGFLSGPAEAMTVVSKHRLPSKK